MGWMWWGLWRTDSWLGLLPTGTNPLPQTALAFYSSDFAQINEI